MRPNSRLAGESTLVKGSEEISLKAAEALAAQLSKKPDSCFGLPTGRTPLGCYEILGRWSREGKLDWSRARCFALDDYLDSEESKSFAYYLEHNLYKHTNLPQNAKFNPRDVDNYDLLIAELGGLDLSLVGIGRNGHVAFNEPGTTPQSWTHCIWLTESTRKANSDFFGSIEQVPRRAVTMGIATILDSREIILLASGQGKQDILQRALNGPITQEVPASFLQSHPRVRTITDFSLAESKSL